MGGVKGGGVGGRTYKTERQRLPHREDAATAEQQNGEGSAKAGQRQQVWHRQEQCYWGSASKDSSSKDGFSKDCAYKGSTG